MMQCASCRRKVEPKRTDAKTCSPACRQVAYWRCLGAPKRRFNVTLIRMVFHGSKYFHLVRYGLGNKTSLYYLDVQTRPPLGSGGNGLSF
jgi:predicted RNA-binding Zn-ribbon protein involved in translation (DUF1610 family)